MRSAQLATALGVVAWLATNERIAPLPTASERPRRMSFHNRLLLNRAAVTKLRTLEVMLVVRDQGIAPASALVERLGGRVRRADSQVGYLRVEVPIEKLLDLVASTEIVAYQISSMSRGTWYRDAQPQLNAEMFRRFEVAPPEGLATTASTNIDLPPLSVEASRQSGYTADDDVGIGEWLTEHPTFDGRGVTIALLESGLPAFADPTLRTGKTLDGRDVAKIAGVLDTLDPDEPDETRVSLSTEVSAATSWCRIGGRTYILPRRGRYRFGLLTVAAGANLVRQFGVLEDQTTREIWVDTNGDADFRDETPVGDVNDRFDVRVLKMTSPRPADLSFVMGRGSAPHTIHIYVGSEDHQTMTVSVAAGSRTDRGLAYGVAPNARVLLVRTMTRQGRLVDEIEGYLEAAKRPDVDVLDDSIGTMIVPDTASDFLGLLFRRVVAVYGKPVFHAASNMQLFMNSASTMGDGFSVGGSIGAKTFASLVGGGTLDGMVVHPVGAAGPSLDGALKPDFLAPMHRIAADLPWNISPDALPKNAAAARLPLGYQISCCTSASSPYAAGVAALLISAAKQQHVPRSLASLERAMRIGARFLPNVPSYQQGNGVLDVNAAWRELTRAVDIPRIVAMADVVHPLAQYAADAHNGQGIFEFDGWASGMTGRRELRLRRESGRRDPVTYRLSWTGNDGTFATMPSVALPRNATIAVPVTIAVSSSGAHSAILNVHDPGTDAIIFRTQATIVAPLRFDATTGSVSVTGTVPLMRERAHYLQIPADVTAMTIELDVIRGTLRAAILPSHGLFPNYYQHVYPALGRDFPKGKYTVVLPNPTAGPWTISIANNPARRHTNEALVSGDEAEYAIVVRLLRASIHPARAGERTISIDLDNLASELQEPMLETSTATLESHHAEFLPTGLPNEFEIAVPDGAATLALRVRSQDPHASSIELYLYDCTSGECFSYDLAFPAAKAQTLVVRQPKAGRWVAAVNPAPSPAPPGGFVLDEIIAMEKPRRSSTPMQPRAHGMRWTERVDIDAALPAAAGKIRVLFFELIDVAAERDAAERPWENRPGFPTLPGRPAAGVAFYPLE